jgi:hypothetical protein
MIFLVALMMPLVVGIQAKGQDAKQDLNAAQKNTNAVAQKEQTAEEWKTFNKSDFELKIKANEMRITELNVKMRKPADLFDSFYVKKIASLEKENRFLKARLEAYEKSQSNWESFKREFNHDMDAIGQALKDLTVDNKK